MSGGKESRLTVSQEPQRQIVAFQLGTELYGLEIGIIHTVIAPQPITRVPKTPDYILGVMNLRGRIVPILDLGLRFGLPAESMGESSAQRIVIVDTGTTTAGLRVDAISEVITLPESAIQTPSGLIATRNIDFITGIGRIPRHENGGESERIILLLDIEKAILPDANLSAINGKSAA